MTPSPSSAARPGSSGSPSTFAVPLRANRETLATVLLAEDDTSCRSSLRRDLRKAGFEVIEAANGLEAFHLFNNHRFDAVATDIVMPAMDGFPLIALILDADPSMPIVAFTGAHHLDPDGPKFLEERRVELLSKPFATEELVGALQRALKHGRV